MASDMFRLDGKVVAVVGAGSIGSLRAEISHRHPSVDFLAVCDVVEEKVRRLASSCEADVWATDAREIVTRDEVDAVIIASTEDAHFEPAMAAIRAGKSVLVEKPFTILADEGHKALVFSQFTTLLGLLRGRLDDAGIVYEYLDGRTRDRAERVARFERDAECPVFLISLKAGGVGLNLTAADYVFLLDPWWNPAVEAQAIDRAHRIGQTRHVFAYRLIARDTVEEKTAGGIYIPDAAKDKPSRGTIIAVGTGKLLDDGTRGSLQVKKGDRVLFTSYAPETIKLDDDDAAPARAEVVLIVIQGDGK